ncbi:chain length determinant protein EpsF [Chitinolyticbacter meiyuanensis]|uniref:chain length determinant protein EpsF n=1 Tax=Chitinolyticbacter meiyuanensis TaxID=682798 RepID=UPI0011E5E877|nr:chain length determinant protein EpsF [Chitinolyticbacter meiyuanensis]
MNLEQLFGTLMARKAILGGVFVAVLVLTFAISSLLPKEYTSTASVAVDVKSTDPVTGLPVSAYMSPGFMATQVDIISSQAVALKVVDSIGIANIPDAVAQFQNATGGRGDIRQWFAEQLRRSLNVRPSRESNVVVLDYTASDPAFSARVVNGFVDAYTKTVIEMKTNAAQASSTFFQQQLGTLKRNLEKAQTDLSAQQQRQGIVNTDERIDLETQRLADLSAQFASTQTQMLDARSRAAGGVNAADVLNNPVIQQLKSQLAQQEAKLEELGQKTGPNHPHYKEAAAELQATRAQLAQLSQQYAGSLGSSANSAASRQNALEAELQGQKERVLELKSQRSRLDILQRDVDNAQRAYDLALQRYSQTSLESRAEQSNVTVLQRATEPLDPSRPKMLINMLLAAVAGLFLGTAAALFAEIRDRRYRSGIDIERLFALPLLIEIDNPNKRRLLALPKVA